MIKESHKRSMTRSAIWRVWGVLFLALVTYLYTGDWIKTTLVTVIHHASFLLIYYLHERFWLWLSWLRNSKWRSWARVFTYEIILGNVVLGLITYLITGEPKTMTAITLTYILNKVWMYVAYDILWGKIKWQTVK